MRNDSCNSRSCRACPIGKQPNRHRSACVTCPEGKVSTFGVCLTCPGTQVQNADQTACIDCPAFQIGRDGVCVCANGFFNFSRSGRIFCYGKLEPAGECAPCPKCVTCVDPLAKGGPRRVLQERSEQTPPDPKSGYLSTDLAAPKVKGGFVRVVGLPEGVSDGLLMPCKPGTCHGVNTTAGKARCEEPFRGYLCQSCETGYAYYPSCPATSS